MKKNTILGAFSDGFKKGYNDTWNEYKASDRYEEIKKGNEEIKEQYNELKALWKQVISK